MLKSLKENLSKLFDETQASIAPQKTCKCGEPIRCSLCNTKKKLSNIFQKLDSSKNKNIQSLDCQHKLPSHCSSCLAKFQIEKIIRSSLGQKNTQTKNMAKITKKQVQNGQEMLQGVIMLKMTQTVNQIEKLKMAQPFDEKYKPKMVQEVDEKDIVLDLYL